MRHSGIHCRIHGCAAISVVIVEYHQFTGSCQAQLAAGNFIKGVFLKSANGQLVHAALHLFTLVSEVCEGDLQAQCFLAHLSLGVDGIAAGLGVIGKITKDCEAKTRYKKARQTALTFLTCGQGYTFPKDTQGYSTL